MTVVNKQELLKKFYHKYTTMSSAPSPKRFIDNQVIGMVLIFIIGMMFGYYFGLTSDFNRSQKTENKNSEGSPEQNEASTGNNLTDETLLYSIEGKIKDKKDDTLTVIGDNGTTYTVSTLPETAIKKINVEYDADKENEHEPIYDIKLGDLATDDYLFIESVGNIGDSYSFQAQYIEVLPPEESQ